MMWILAVAVGPTMDLSINSTQVPDTVRPYINGLVAGLGARGHTIGIDYLIEYRQRTASHLDASAFAGPKDAVFCMSTTVVRAAAQNRTTGVPIVGIVSDPDEEGFTSADYICGVSANRFQTAGTCLQYFLQAVPSLTSLLVLHNPDNRPCLHALENARKVADTYQPPIAVHVLNVSSSAEVGERLRKLHKREAASPATDGILVLPVDVNFGAAADIIALQNSLNLPAWFPTPDWVAEGAFGAYGASQEVCGREMAERVDYAWKAGVKLPNPRWRTIDPSAFEWHVNSAVAANLKIRLDGVPKSHIK